MPTNIQRESLSNEVIETTVYSTTDLTSQTVEIAIVDALIEPVDADFGAANWIGTAGKTRVAQLPAATYAPGSWDVYVRVTDIEVPVIYAGRMLVV